LISTRAGRDVVNVDVVGGVQVQVHVNVDVNVSRA
jgi:hypothetical protein